MSPLIASTESERLRIAARAEPGAQRGPQADDARAGKSPVRSQRFEPFETEDDLLSLRYRGYLPAEFD